MPDRIELALVDSGEEAQAFLRWLGERRPLLAFDVETTGLDVQRDRVRLAQFGDAMTGWAMDWRDWRGLVRHVFATYEGPIAAHNFKFDSSMAEQDGVRVPRERMHCTQNMVHLDGSQGPKGLKLAAARRLGRWALAGERELKDAMRRGKWTWATVPTDFKPYWMYGALDTVITARLGEALWSGVVEGRAEAYDREMEVGFILMEMEQRGVPVDLAYCERAIRKLERQWAEIASRWPDLNLNAPAQIAARLRKEGVRLTTKTRKGIDSMAKSVLEGVDHPLAVDTLEARGIRRQIDSYLQAYVDLAVDGVLHPNFNPLGAEKTGRMSISRPSMQNLPRKRIVRQAIVAGDEDHVLLLADYQAQEMRVLAHYSGDPNMTEAFWRGEDMHSFTAREAYGVAEPTKQQRQTAKSAGFAKVYGAGAEKFSLTAKIKLAEGKRFLAKYDRLFPGVARFQHEAIAAVRAREDDEGMGWVETIGGRRLQVPVDKAYVAVNYVIQGGCSDITKDAMIACQRAGVGEFMVLQIHDELMFRVPRELVGDVSPVVRECMEREDLRVPMPVELETVGSWGERYD